MRKVVLLTIFLVYSIHASAFSKPLGIDLNRTSLKEVQRTYTVLRSEWKEPYRFYYLKSKANPIVKMEDIIIATDVNDIIKCVQRTYPKEHFTSLTDELRSKYVVIKDLRVSKGPKNILLKTLHSEIRVYVPENSEVLYLTYATDKCMYSLLYDFVPDMKSSQGGIREILHSRLGFYS